MFQNLIITYHNHHLQNIIQENKSINAAFVSYVLIIPGNSLMYYFFVAFTIIRSISCNDSSESDYED